MIKHALTFLIGCVGISILTFTYIIYQSEVANPYDTGYQAAVKDYDRGYQAAVKKFRERHPNPMMLGAIDKMSPECRVELREIFKKGGVE